MLAGLSILQGYYQLIAVNLSKQKQLDSDPGAIQQTEFYGTLDTKSKVCTILGKSKKKKQY